MSAFLPPTRLERLLLAGAYTSTTGIGVSVLIEPPVLADVLGQIVTIFWCGFILLAAPCIPAVLRARYRLEYMVLPFLLAALTLSVVALWIHFGNGDVAYTLPRVLVATALVFMFSWRLASLHRIVKLTGAGETRWIQRRYLFKRRQR